MPRLRIIILEKKGRDLNFVLWADVPVARQSHYAHANAQSVWSGANAQDNLNLGSGAVTERVAKMTVSSGLRLQQIQTMLETQWQTFQRTINDNNEWERYGSTWDGTTWNVVTNP